MRTENLVHQINTQDSAYNSQVNYKHLSFTSYKQMY